MTAKEKLKKNLEWLEDNYDMSQDEEKSVIKAMQEFAQYHVKQALQEAFESIPGLGSSTDIPDYHKVENAILNAYSSENIK